MRLPPLIRPQFYVEPTLDTATWFLQLRWMAVAGQLVTMAFVALVLQISFPVWKLLALISVTAVTNLAYAWWLSRLYGNGLHRADRLPNQTVVSFLMLSDIIVLTGMLYLSAGIANPFSLFYFVNIAVAGALITPTSAWSIWAATVAGVVLLLFQAQPIEELSSASLLSVSSEQQVWTIPKAGFLVAFVTCSSVITYFITILTGELRQREHARQEAERVSIRNQQLESLATLAAGAAHELATPMSTIAVVAGELDRRMRGASAEERLLDDVGLIRSELDHCRHILDRMISAAGEASGEPLREVKLEEFLDEALLGLRDATRVQVEFMQPHIAPALIPIQAVAQALRNVVQNAIDASPSEQTVRVVGSDSEDAWKIEVHDRGTGMPDEVLSRLGEPFYTTKEPGRGMGLGIYLTNNVLRRLNGKLEFSSHPNQGTTASLTIPKQRD